MTRLKRRVRWVLGVCLVMVMALALCFHFFHPEILDGSRGFIAAKPKPTPSKRSAPLVPSLAAGIGMEIEDKLRTLDFARLSARFLEERTRILEALVHDIQMKKLESPWKVAASWVNSSQTYPKSVPELGAILHAMVTSRVEVADVGRKGTQLKMLLTLEGGQWALFKPKRFERDHVVGGPPYAGADRHNGEIVAFHLSRILDLRRVPLAVGRKLDLVHEAKPVATEPLLKTFFQRGNSTCFYGRCYYCRPSDPACAEGSVLEGALILWLPDQAVLKRHRHPWQRTYKDNVFARWETDAHYCDRVRRVPAYASGRLLLDLVDASIFDYLIGNADRHHYETIAMKQGGGEPSVLLIDNGKSFGNPYWDELTVLAPLYQCCRVRSSTVSRLRVFVGHLGSSLEAVLSSDPLSPLLSPPHLEALDRRLRTVLAVLEVCSDQHGTGRVFVDG